MISEKEQHTPSEIMPEHQNQLEGNFTIDANQKQAVMVSLLSIFHNNISAWYSRAYQAATWGVGIQFSIVGYFFVSTDRFSFSTILVACVATGIFSFAIFQYLTAAIEGHKGNRLAIAKCEGALHLYESGTYLKDSPFFTFSKEMLRSSSLDVIRVLHCISTFVCLLMLIGGLLYYGK